eukprot:4761177-Pyramimonas_sp.AAC.2
MITPLARARPAGVHAGGPNQAVGGGDPGRGEDRAGACLRDGVLRARLFGVLLLGVGGDP